MSGRTLRRIPVLAHARYIGDGLNGLERSATYTDRLTSEEGDTENGDEAEECDGSDENEGEDDAEDLEVWLDAMMETVEEEKEQMMRVELCAE